jgi:hypothetical protein
MCARIDDAVRKAGKRSWSVRELAPQAFRHRWVRGRIAKERAGKRTFLAVPSLKEHKAVKTLELLRDVVCINGAQLSKWSQINVFVNYMAAVDQFIEKFILACRNTRTT